MNRLKNFIETSITYLAGNILSKLVTFFLIPLYTNKFSAAEYGSYDVIATVVTLLVSVGFFQIWDGMFRVSFEVQTDDDKYHVISDCFKGYGLGIIVFTILFFIINKLLSFELIFLPYLFGIFMGLQYMYSFSARVFLKNKLFAFSGVACTFFVAITNVFLIVVLKVGVSSLFISQIIGCICQIIIIEVRLRLVPRFFKYHINTYRFKKIVSFSVPLCIATVSYWLLSGFTKITIREVCGPEENGLFAIASSISNVAVIAVNVFQFAWNETAYLIANEENRTTTYNICLNLLFSTVWISCAAFCCIVNFLFPYYVGNNFRDSSSVIPYLMIGVSANAIAGFLGTLFMTEEKTNYIMYSTLIASLFNVLLSSSAASKFGLIGSVVILSFSFIILMVLRLIQIRKSYSITILPVSVISVLFAIISIVLSSLNVNRFIMFFFVIVLIPCYYIIFEKITGNSMWSLMKRFELRSHK